jgi:hypothetical protein
MAVEEEEKDSRHRDRGAKREENMDHPYVISSPLLLDRVLHNPQ